MAFSSLLYTECPPDRSVHGREGLQFQAESPDATPEMEQAVIAHLLYRPSRKLMAADTPVDAHPLSFAYQRVRDHYYLGVGRYAGRDTHGREGNQLTHCLVTADSDDIRPARPAQLFGSGAWLTVSAESTRLPSVTAPLHVAELYQPGSLHAMARARPGIETFLPKLLTAFEEAAGTHRKKLVVSATDVEVAIRWIALGGLFLEPADALSLSFRVFTESPLADDLSIAVFHPELTRSAPSIQTLPPALNGVDLDSLLTSAITASPSATVYARWFLEYDAFDALEAIELGRRWQPHLASPAVSTAIAGIVCLDRRVEPDLTAATIAEALTAVCAHEPDDMDEYGGALADAVLTIPPAATDDPATLHRAAVALRRADHHDAAEALTLALLEGTRNYPDTYGVRWSEATHEPRPGDTARARWMIAETRQRAVRLLSETLDAAHENSLGPLFTLIPGLGLGLRFESVRAPGLRLARHWATYPDAVSEEARIAFYAEIEALVWKELESRIRDRDVTVRRAVAAGRWDRLRASAGSYDASSPVTAALTAAAVAAAPHPQRLAVLHEYLTTATAPDWSLFFGHGAPDPELLGVWLSAVPSALRDPAFADVVVAAINDELAHHRSCVLLDRVERVYDVPRALTAIVAEHIRAKEVLRTLDRHQLDIPNPALDDLITVDRRFQDFYVHNIAKGLVWQSDLVGVRRYLSVTRAHHLQTYFSHITTAHLRDDLPEFAHQLLYVCLSEDTLAWMRVPMEEAFVQWIRQSGNKKRALDAARHIDRSSQAMWNSFVEDASTGRAAHRPAPRKLLSITKFRKGGR